MSTQKAGESGADLYVRPGCEIRTERGHYLIKTDDSVLHQRSTADGMWKWVEGARDREKAVVDQVEEHFKGLHKRLDALHNGLVAELQGLGKNHRLKLLVLAGAVVLLVGLGAGLLIGGN